MYMCTFTSFHIGFFCTSLVMQWLESQPKKRFALRLVGVFCDPTAFQAIALNKPLKVHYLVDSAANDIGRARGGGGKIGIV